MFSWGLLVVHLALCSVYSSTLTDFFQASEGTPAGDQQDPEQNPENIKEAIRKAEVIKAW